MSKPLILTGSAARTAATRMIWEAPEGWEVELKAPSKTRQQEKLFHALLPEFARAPEVRARWGWHTVEEWKAEIVKACFGVVVRTSILNPEDMWTERVSTKGLTRRQYADLITYMESLAAGVGYRWKAYRPGDPIAEEDAA